MDDYKEILPYIEKKDVLTLAKALFKVTLTPKQCLIARAMAYEESKRIVIAAMTRWGKSYGVSIGILLYILFHEDKKINLISPTFDQTGILRNYEAEFISVCPPLLNLLEVEYGGIERLKKEI